MRAEDTVKKWPASVNTLKIGATSAEGGTRGKTVTIGGAKSLPWLAYEGEVGSQPAIAIEIWDSGADAWPEELKQQYGESMKNPITWAQKASELGVLPQDHTP